MKFLYILFVITLFTGCFSKYPLNMSESEYNQLSIEEKLKAKQKQAELDNLIKLEKLKKAQQENRYKHELALKEKKRVEKLYKNNQEKLFVSIKGGSFKYMKDGYRIIPFEIIPYEVKRVNVYNKKTNRIHHHIWVSFQPSGFYVGIKPEKPKKHLESYIEHNVDKFFKVNNDAPYVIPKSSFWDNKKGYTVSFNERYEAKNLNVKLLLQYNYKQQYR